MEKPARTKKFILLHDENFRWLALWCKAHHLPKSTPGLLIDDFIQNMKRTILELEKREGVGESVTLTDLFAATGHTMENLNKQLQNDSGVVNSTKPQQ
jgi:hypothetical protein